MSNGLKTIRGVYKAPYLNGVKVSISDLITIKEDIESFFLVKNDYLIVKQIPLNECRFYE